MNISHHPPEDLLAKFATGTLPPAERLVVAVHVSMCRHCRRLSGAIEHLAGEALEDATPVRLADGAFESVMARIKCEPAAPQAEAAFVNDDDALPPILRRCRIGKRRRVAPGVSLRPILLPEVGNSRAFLLQSAPGTRMLEHSHTGTELTCVLEGSFSHQGGTYRPGDFDFGDDAVDHQPVVGGERDCLCVVAMTGDLRMNGLFGRLIGPFVRI
jgi:putative transcriptional regulator